MSAPPLRARCRRKTDACVTFSFQLDVVAHIAMVELETEVGW